VRLTAKALKKRRELSRELVAGHLDTCQSKLLLMSVLEHELIANLSSSQHTRLLQLTLQKRGVYALKDADMLVALDLTDVQRMAINTIFEKLPPQARPARRHQLEESFSNEMEALHRELSTQLLSVLSERQKVRWSALQGVPFCFRTGKSMLVAADASE
jgi:hypothetical protein